MVSRARQKGENPTSYLDTIAPTEYHQTTRGSLVFVLFALSPTPVKHRPQHHGDVLTAISDGMVALLKEFYGRGPTRTKSYYEDDLVVCVLRGGFSRVEQTLLAGGRGAAVIRQRM